MVQLTKFSYLDPASAMVMLADAINDHDDQIAELQSGGSSGGGSQGPAGPQGPQGDPGPPGPQGPQGDLGPPGPQGPAGSAGQDGAQGPAGVAGQQGAPGSQGPAGTVGPQGPAGTVGPQGPQGPQGVQGSQGAAGTGITMKGSVATSSALPATGNTQGDAYIVSADDSLWIWNGSQWISGGSIQGPPGAQGPAGAQGVAGAPGQAGAQGLKGDTGAPGGQGPQGPTGAAGTQGVQGPPGPTAVSANAGNTATLGSDNLIFVPLAPAASNAIPAMDGTGSAGSANAWSRGDHVHQTDTSRYAASNPSGFQTAAQVTAALPVAASTAPVMDGTAAAGVGTTWARADHVHPTDTSRAPVKGVTDGSNAAAGNVGEQVSASVTTAVTLTTGVSINIATLALTAGDWSVSGVIIFNEAANTVPTALAAAISMTSATLPTAAQVAAGTGNATQYNLAFTKGPISQTMQAGVCRVSVSAGTTVYLVAQAAFSTAGLTATGYISARRVR